MSMSSKKILYGINKIFIIFVFAIESFLFSIDILFLDVNGTIDPINTGCCI